MHRVLKIYLWESLWTDFGQSKLDYNFCGSQPLDNRSTGLVEVLTYDHTKPLVKTKGERSTQFGIVYFFGPLLRDEFSLIVLNWSNNLVNTGQSTLCVHHRSWLGSPNFSVKQKRIETDTFRKWLLDKMHTKLLYITLLIALYFCIFYLVHSNSCYITYNKNNLNFMFYYSIIIK